MFVAGIAEWIKVGRMWNLRMVLRDSRSPINIAGFTRVFLPIIAVPLLTIGSFGQTQAPVTEEALLDSSVQSLSTFRVKVDEVDLSFTVRDRHNHWVTNLSEGDIRVLDNGQPPKSILKFQSQADLPLRVGLIID